MKIMIPICLTLFVGATTPLFAQELDPGAYSISPAGLNIVVASNNFSGGGVTFDPSLPVEDASARVNTTAVALVRALSVFGSSGSVGMALPYSIGHIEGFYIGEFTTVDRSGFRDLQMRFAVNLIGAPAMSLRQFAAYRQTTNLGFSFVAVAPTGQYDNSKLINLSSNRWAFKPEVGLSHAFGKWTLELYGGVWLFTDNRDFFNGRTRSQAPLGSMQVHLLYTFRPRIWLALDGNFYAGGRTTVDDRANLDLQTNSRLGVTFSVPLDGRQSLKFGYSRGAYSSIGADFHSLVVGYQFFWGAGL